MSGDIPLVPLYALMAWTEKMLFFYCLNSVVLFSDMIYCLFKHCHTSQGISFAITHILILNVHVMIFNWLLH
jgi:hypothetical protein